MIGARRGRVPFRVRDDITGLKGPESSIARDVREEAIREPGSMSCLGSSHNKEWNGRKPQPRNMDNARHGKDYLKTIRNKSRNSATPSGN